jgi:DNA-binding MurR/RpiR family transcriptional regulator
VDDSRWNLVNPDPAPELFPALPYGQDDEFRAALRQELEACAAIAEAHARECALAGEDREAEIADEIAAEIRGRIERTLA